MKFKVLIVVLLVFISKASALQPSSRLEYENPSKTESIDTDSLMQGIFSDTIARPKVPTIDNKKSNTVTPLTLPKESKVNELKIQSLDTILQFKLPVKIIHVPIDSLLFLANSFFIEMVYKGLPYTFKWDIHPDFRTLYYSRKATTLNDFLLKPIESISPEQTVADLRQYAREQIIQKEADLYVMNFDDLPDPEGYKSHLIEGKSIKNLGFDTDDKAYKRRRIIVKREQHGPWLGRASALVQFSQNYVSSNWYQGGNSNLAVLGILTGQMNYDDKKCVQWENYGEWRLGFNSVTGDSLRMLSTNDDVIKINSKLGVKAGGNWFYSSSVDFSTQFFNSYNGINSTTLKTSFMTPIRLNLGVGLDYKYKGIFSLMIAPVSYKYIYVYDSNNVDPNLFGVKKGEKVLSEFGSSFNSIFSYSLSKEIQLYSKLSFYTNYQKVEIDWEMVCNMTINRFMSTRISFNPRYDNTVIFTSGERAQLQFKQLISVGFAHKFN